MSAARRAGSRSQGAGRRARGPLLPGSARRAPGRGSIGSFYAGARSWRPTSIVGGMPTGLPVTASSSVPVIVFLRAWLLVGELLLGRGRAESHAIAPVGAGHDDLGWARQ